MKKKTKKSVGCDDYLLDDLQELFKISDQILADARLKSQRRQTVGTVDVLMRNGVINVDKLTAAKAHHFGYSVADMSYVRSYGELEDLFPVELAKIYKMIPTHIIVAACDPVDFNALDDIGRYFQLRFGIGFRVEVASEEAISKVIKGARSKNKRTHNPFDILG